MPQFYNPPRRKRDCEWGAEQRFLADWLQSPPMPLGVMSGNDDRGRQSETVIFNKLPLIGLTGKHRVRDLWQHKDLPDTTDTLQVTIPAHGAVVLKLTATTLRQ